MWSPHRLHSDGFSSQRTSEGTTAWIEYQTKKAEKAGKSRAASRKSSNRKGDGTEWYLLNFPRMPIFPNILSYYRPKLGQQWVSIWPSFHSPLFDSSWTQTHALLRYE
jgi:hypothetical protein